jgi:hypothetical protein
MGRRRLALPRLSHGSLKERSRLVAQGRLDRTPMATRQRRDAATAFDILAS